MNRVVAHIFVLQRIILAALFLVSLSGTTQAQPRDAWQAMVGALETKVAEADAKDIRLSVGVAGLAGPNEGMMTLLGSSESYPPASTIKLLLIATLMQQVDAGVLSLDDTAIVEQSDIVGGYGDIQHEPVPNEVPLSRLATLTVTVSDNTATNVLVDVVGYDAMKALAAQLGLETMYFGRKMFETPQPPEKQNYINAEDSILLLKAIFEGTFLSADARHQILTWMTAQTVKTKIGAGIPDSVPLAHKTGENASVTHDLGYLLWPGREVALAIFAESQVSDDFETVQQLVNPVVAEVAATVYTFLKP